MRLRSVGFAAFTAVALVQSCQPACTPAPPAPPAEPPPLSIVIVDGQGNGHGRGLSAWGAYGLAVNHGWAWYSILDHYYGGTQLTQAAPEDIRIRLTALDDAYSVGIVSVNRTLTWNGGSYGSIQAHEITPNHWDLYGTSDIACIGGGGGWTLIGQGVQGPLRFTTPQDETSAPAGDVLGLCQPNATVRHYRGSLTVTEDSATGANRVVNGLLVDNYLRGVLSREVSTSWGDAGGGAGMHALYAMAVAARSFGMSQSRYSYADTCDTSACQVYGGAAHRDSAVASTSHPTVRVCEPGNLTFECANTDRAVASTAGWVRTRVSDGRLISGEYSATHGPRSAGGSFPPVDDWFSNVPQNPLYQWARHVDAAAVAARYGLGTLTGAATERDPATIYDGIWGNRVVLYGTAGSVVTSALEFRNAFGLPSHGFVIRGVA